LFEYTRENAVASKCVVVRHLICDFVFDGVIESPLQKSWGPTADDENNEKKNVSDEETSDVQILQVRHESNDDNDDAHNRSKHVEQGQKRSEKHGLPLHALCAVCVVV
jgi:hypothetical protein